MASKMAFISPPPPALTLTHFGPLSAARSFSVCLLLRCCCCWRWWFCVHERCYLLDSRARWVDSSEEMEEWCKNLLTFTLLLFLMIKICIFYHFLQSLIVHCSLFVAPVVSFFFIFIFCIFRIPFFLLHTPYTHCLLSIFVLCARCATYLYVYVCVCARRLLHLHCFHFALVPTKLNYKP